MPINEPQPPTRCDRHGEEWVDITNFGSPIHSVCMCTNCGDDVAIGADDLHERDLAMYKEMKREWDRQTPRILELEAELRDARMGSAAG
jgi:hypothetical protein